MEKQCATSLAWLSKYSPVQGKPGVEEGEQLTWPASHWEGYPKKRWHRLLSRAETLRYATPRPVLYCGDQLWTIGGTASLAFLLRGGSALSLSYVEDRGTASQALLYRTCSDQPWKKGVQLPPTVSAEPV